MEVEGQDQPPTVRLCSVSVAGIRRGARLPALYLCAALQGYSWPTVHRQETQVMSMKPPSAAAPNDVSTAPKGYYLTDPFFHLPPVQQLICKWLLLLLLLGTVLWMVKKKKPLL